MAEVQIHSAWTFLGNQSEATRTREIRTFMVATMSCPRETMTPVMIESFEVPKTPMDPKRYFLLPSNRANNPPIKLLDM